MLEWLYEAFTEQRGDATYLTPPWWFWVAYCVPPMVALVAFMGVCVRTARTEGARGFACLSEPELALAAIGGLCLLPVWPGIALFVAWDWAMDKIASRSGEHAPGPHHPAADGGPGAPS